MPLPAFFLLCTIASPHNTAPCRAAQRVDACTCAVKVFYAHIARRAGGWAGELQESEVDDDGVVSPRYNGLDFAVFVLRPGEGV